MSLINVQLYDLLKQLIECLVAVRDNQCALLGPVVVDVVDDLHGHIRLARSRWTNHLRLFLHFKHFFKI